MSIFRCLTFFIAKVVAGSAILQQRLYFFTPDTQQLNIQTQRKRRLLCHALSFEGPEKTRVQKGI